jgi:hypothetical protein
LIEPDSSNTFGRSAVTFRMYYKHNHVMSLSVLHHLHLWRRKHLPTVNTVLFTDTHVCHIIKLHVSAMLFNHFQVLKIFKCTHKRCP